MRTRDAQGQDILSSYAPIPGTSWGFVDHQAWQTLMKSSQGYRRILLLLLALGVVVPALVVVVGVQRITRPVNELIGAAEKVARGDYGQAISAHTGDEIEELAEQFNIMSARLQESYAQLSGRAEARTEELAALNDIAAVISQSLNLDDILNAALKRTLQVLEIENGGIYLLDEDSGLLTIAAARGFSSQFVDEIDRLKVGEGFSGRVVETGEPLVVRDVSADPRLTRIAVREERFRSLAAVPLNAKGKALGAMFALTRGYHEFSNQDVQLLASIGHQVGIAIENARLFAQAAQRMHEMETLYHSEQRRAEQFRVIGEVGRQITSILAVDELLWRMARLIQEAFHYYHVGIALTEGDEVVYRIGAGSLWDDPTFRFSPARLKVGKEGIGGWVAATGQPLLVPDVMREPRYVWMRGSKTRSELAVPITVKGQVFGVLDVQSDEPNAFDAADQAVLQTLAHQAAIAIENARLYEQARQVAVMEERNRLARDLHDAVTQTLFSASLISEALPELWEKDPAEARELLGELKRLSRGALAEMRTLLLELRPVAMIESNLVSLLRQLGEAVTGRTGLPVTVTVERTCALPADVHVALYRIAQEALNNVVKHANAHHVAVNLICTHAPGGGGREDASGAELEVSDDGRGFDPRHIPPDRLGLGILRERAEAIGATLHIDSEPGAGTHIRVVWTANVGRRTTEEERRRENP
jgi:nitrate/nitrite-specific signal transduction histidine kinase